MTRAVRRPEPPGRTRRRLLERFMADAPFQPATNLWRCVELPVLAAALPAAGRGLDVGCGDGVLTAILRDLAGADWELVGVDPDPVEAAAAAASGVYRAVHPVPADGIPEPAGRFDFAFANSVLEHIPGLPACLREVARVLAPGGLFAATVPAPRFRELLAGPDWTRRQARAEYLADVDDRLAHHNYWDAGRWAAELTAAGLDPLPTAGYLTAAQVRRWEVWSNWTGGLVHRLRGRREKPLAFQQRVGLKRRLPAAARGLAGPLARAVGAGVLDLDPAGPADAGCLLVRGRRPGGRGA